MGRTSFPRRRLLQPAFSQLAVEVLERFIRNTCLGKSLLMSSLIIYCRQLNELIADITDAGIIKRRILPYGVGVSVLPKGRQPLCVIVAQRIVVGLQLGLESWPALDYKRRSSAPASRLRGAFSPSKYSEGEEDNPLQLRAWQALLRDRSKYYLEW
jgi:hypothetical protein